MRQDTEPWWKQAEAELDAADFNLNGGYYYVASWLAQQAAEKALKALYVERHGQLPPRTHDLPLLGGRLGAPAGLQNDLALLNPVAGLARYPDVAGRAPVDAVSLTHATAHVDATRRVLRWVGALL